MMAIREWLAPMAAAGFAVVALPLWIWFISKVNHGGSFRKPPRRGGRVGLSSRPDGRVDYSADVVHCRKVGRDDATGRSQHAAHRLVDRAGLCDLPGDHAQHVDRVRGAGAGTKAGSNVRSVPRVASPDREGVGTVASASGQLALPLNSAPCSVGIDLYSTGAV
jgi:hypothetical protein